MAEAGPDRRPRGVEPYSRALTGERPGLDEPSCDMAWQATGASEWGRARERSRAQGHDRAQGRGRARRRLVRRNTESRCLTSLAGGKTPVARQTVVGTAGEVCIAMVRRAGACTTEVKSAGSCTAEAKSAEPCTAEVRSAEACTVEVRSAEASTAVAKSTEACAAAIAAWRAMRRALRAVWAGGHDPRPGT